MTQLETATQTRLRRAKEALDTARVNELAAIQALNKNLHLLTAQRVRHGASFIFSYLIIATIPRAYSSLVLIPRLRLRISHRY